MQAAGDYKIYNCERQNYRIMKMPVIITTYIKFLKYCE